MNGSDASATHAHRTDGSDRPRVSVVIAARNAGSFIADALRSALTQTMRDVEVIVVDDGSTDDTSSIVEACSNGDPRVLLLRNDRSQGVSGARNRALAHARGDWIAVLDADDEFLPDRLERMVVEATGRELDMLADNLCLRDFATNASLGRAYPAEWMTRPDLLTLADLLERDRPGLQHKMFGCIKPIMRRSFLVDNNITYRDDVWCAEDFLLYAQTILKNARFGVMNEPLYVYAERSDSVSASGIAAYRAAEVARVNRLLAHMAHGRSVSDDRLLTQRQAQYDYFAFAQFLKAKRFYNAALTLPRLSINHLARSVLAAATRRLKRV